MRVKVSDQDKGNPKHMDQPGLEAGTKLEVPTPSVGASFTTLV